MAGSAKRIFLRNAIVQTRVMCTPMLVFQKARTLRSLTFDTVVGGEHLEERGGGFTGVLEDDSAHEGFGLGVVGRELRRKSKTSESKESSGIMLVQ